MDWNPIIVTFIAGLLPFMATVITVLLQRRKDINAPKKDVAEAADKVSNAWERLSHQLEDELKTKNALLEQYRVELAKKERGILVLIGQLRKLGIEPEYKNGGQL